MTITDSNPQGIVYDAGASGIISNSYFIHSIITGKIISVNGDVNIKVFKRVLAEIINF